MLSPLLLAFCAALLSLLPGILYSFLGTSLFFSKILNLLGVIVFIGLIQKFFLDRKMGLRNYQGLSDLLIHIHLPATPDSSSRWGLRGLISFVLSLFGFPVGVEGASAECAHGLAIRTRDKSARWFEQKRRTDAGAALAGAISATFGAPFTGILVPMELGIGGRALTTVLASLLGFLVARFFPDLMPFGQILKHDQTFPAWNQPKLWGLVLIITVVLGLMSGLVLHFFRWSEEALGDFFKKLVWFKVLGGGILLILLFIAVPQALSGSAQLFTDFYFLKRGSDQALLLFITLLVAFGLTLVTFGTLGIFSPIFVIGGIFGFVLEGWISPIAVNSEIAHEFTRFAMVVGGSALWGGILGMPLAGAVVSYELTQDVSLLFPCLIAAAGANLIRQSLKLKPFVLRGLQARGVGLIDGRASMVLSEIKIKEAMVTDHAIVSEIEAIDSLYQKVQSSRYPFFPVVQKSGMYVGLLTADLIHEAWLLKGASQAIEAKDLLYRSGSHIPSVKEEDVLSDLGQLFDQHPCLPVIRGDGQVSGLLFPFNVRLAYDREVARRSLSLQHQVLVR